MAELFAMQHLPPTVFTLAFGFGNLWMLAWLAAAAAPLLIHLWSRNRHRETPWAAMEFLLTVMRKHSRRIRIQHLLLLAVRTAIIALVVLAVAQPYAEQLGRPFTAGKRTHRVFVVDRSYSMDYQPQQASRLFDRAKQLVIGMVRASPQGDGFSLIDMGNPPQVVVGGPAFEPSNFIDEVTALKVSHAGADLAATLGKVEQVITQGRKSHPGLVQTQVVVLSDMSRVTWSAAVDANSANAGPRSRLMQIAEMAPLIIIDLGLQDAANLAVTDLHAAEPLATVTQDVTLEAVVRNFSDRSYAQHPVELIVDGTRIRKTSVDLRPRQDTSCRFDYRFLSPGSHQVELALGSDALDVDNHRWLSVLVRSRLRILCVSGRPGSTYYVARALDPLRSAQSTIQVDEVAESELVERSLSDYDCIFLCNVAQLTDQEARLLHSYLQQGGGLVFFLGDQVMADRYNSELGGTDDDVASILPARIMEPVPEGVYHFDPREFYDHPVISVFRDREQAGLQTAPVFRYFRLKVPAKSPDVQTVLAFENGDPAIVERTVGRGRSLLVATAPSLDPNNPNPWTTLPTWPSFLPLVQELMARSVQSGADAFNVQVGQSLGMTVPLNAAGADLVLTPPDEQPRTIRVQADGDSADWSFDEVDTSGMYTAQFGEPVSTTQHFAVNVDTRESDLSKIDVSGLPDTLTVETDWQSTAEVPAGEITGAASLHKWFIGAAILLMLFETLLASRFNRSSS